MNVLNTNHQLTEPSQTSNTYNWYLLGNRATLSRIIPFPYLSQTQFRTLTANFQAVLQQYMEEPDQAYDGRQSANTGAGGASHLHVRPA